MNKNNLLTPEIELPSLHTVNLDAANEIFGRLASKVAVILRGKTRADFDPAKLPQEKVAVYNIQKIRFSGKKFNQKVYHRYSGYPGGLKTRSLEKEWPKNPVKIFKKTVYDMLPKNRLRSQIIKNLTVT